MCYYCYYPERHYNHHSERLRKLVIYPFNKYGIDILGIIEAKETEGKKFTVSLKDYLAYAFLFFRYGWCYFIRTKDLPKLGKGKESRSFSYDNIKEWTKKDEKSNSFVGVNKLIQKLAREHWEIERKRRGIVTNSTQPKRTIKVRRADYYAIFERMITSVKNQNGKRIRLLEECCNHQNDQYTDFVFRMKPKEKTKYKHTLIKIHETAITRIGTQNDEYYDICLKDLADSVSKHLNNLKNR